MKKLLAVVILVSASACTSLKNVSPLPQGRSVEPHKSFVTFCAKNPDSCKVPLTARAYNEIQAVHAELRSQFLPKWDEPGLEGDIWQIGMEGDCEDYALTLQSQFRIAYPHYASSFRLATAYIDNGAQYHAVLTIETLQGTLVCDVLKPECADWRSFDYQFDLREDGLAWMKFDALEMVASIEGD